jgi:hypothetical protein
MSLIDRGRPAMVRGMANMLVGFTVLGWLGAHLCVEHDRKPSEYAFLVLTAVSAFVALCWYVGHSH